MALPLPKWLSSARHWRAARIANSAPKECPARRSRGAGKDAKLWPNQVATEPSMVTSPKPSDVRNRHLSVRYSVTQSLISVLDPSRQILASASGSQGSSENMSSAFPKATRGIPRRPIKDAYIPSAL